MAENNSDNFDRNEISALPDEINEKFINPANEIIAKRRPGGNKGFRLKTLLIASLLFILVFLIGVTSATYIKTLEQRANNFMVGKVNIEIEETEWDKSGDKITYPGREIDKDPKVKNTGTNNAYIYIEVQVPRFNIKTYDDTGSLVIREEPFDMFTFSVNTGWELIDTYTTPDSGYSCYIYAYTSDIVRPGESTGTLFDSVKFVCELEGQLGKGTKLEMPLYAYAIQCEYLNESGSTIRDKMIDAYEKYKTES